MLALFGIIWLEWHEAEKQTNKAARNKIFFKYLFCTILVCCLLVFMVCRPWITWDKELDPYVTPEMVEDVSAIGRGLQMPISVIVPVFALKLHITDIYGDEGRGTWLHYDQYTFVGPFYVGILEQQCPSGFSAIPLPYGGVHSED